MDFVMIYRLIRCLNEGLPLDINVYDGVLWSSITPLSELSVKVARKHVPLAHIPDSVHFEREPFQHMLTFLLYANDQCLGHRN